MSFLLLSHENIYYIKRRMIRLKIFKLKSIFLTKRYFLYFTIFSVILKQNCNLNEPIITQKWKDNKKTINAFPIAISGFSEILISRKPAKMF